MDRIINQSGNVIPKHSQKCKAPAQQKPGTRCRLLQQWGQLQGEEPPKLRTRPERRDPGKPPQPEQLEVAEQ